MEKLKMQSENLVNENIGTIAELFPNCVTEGYNENGKLIKMVDFDLLKQELSYIVVEGNDERYTMTWPGKKQSILTANSPINATLRPCKEESVDFDNTQNLYIEGNNLDTLKLLRETYLNKIKMIYVDPPYNTGNNIIYKNDFSMSADEFMKVNGDYDEVGNRLFMNSDVNGRFHTDWLNNIYPVLRLAKDLLTNDGYITIAIDDNEVYNLKKIMDEIYGEMNYIGTIVTRCNPQGRNKNNIDPVHEYHLVYAKSILEMPLLRLKKSTDDKAYGYLMRSGTNSRKFERPYRFYPMLVKDGKVGVITDEEYNNIYAKNKKFDDQFIEELKNKYEKLGYKFILPISKDGEEKVWQRMFDRVKNEYQSYIYEGGQIKVPAEEDRTPISLWGEEKYSNVAYGANRLKEMFGTSKAPFDFSKSIYTVKDLISLNTSNKDIVLDFYPGSGTTAEAVLQLNAEDGGKRQFILVQLPEKCSEDSDGYALGYKIIPDIAEKRIYLAGEKLKKENNLSAQNFDTGFRVLKLDSSCMKDIYYNPEDVTQDLLIGLEDNIKEDRTPEDLLFQVMLDMGVLLSSKIEEKLIKNKKVFIVGEYDNDSQPNLICCFDNDLTDDVVKEIAKMKPLYAVFRDSSIATDSVNVNFDQIFETYSPTTTRKVI